MYCKYCGAEITDSHFNNGVCRSCITRMAQQSSAAKQETPVYTAPAAPQPEAAPQQQTVAPNIALDNNAPAQVYATLTPEAQPAKQPNPRMLGFGKALAGTIIGGVGYFMSFFLYFGVFLGFVDEEMLTFAIVLSVILIIPTIVATLLPLIFGINSIKTFRRATGPKPIATLILGINAVYFAALSAIILMLSFFILISGVMML